MEIYPKKWYNTIIIKTLGGRDETQRKNDG